MTCKFCLLSFHVCHLYNIYCLYLRYNIIPVTGKRKKDRDESFKPPRKKKKSTTYRRYTTGPVTIKPSKRKQVMPRSLQQVTTTQAPTEYRPSGRWHGHRHRQPLCRFMSFTVLTRLKKVTVRYTPHIMSVVNLKNKHIIRLDVFERHHKWITILEETHDLTLSQYISSLHVPFASRFNMLYDIIDTMANIGCPHGSLYSTTVVVDTGMLRSDTL